MSCCSEHHKKLTDGVGKCSVPMWCNGLPAGFCDEPAYGAPPPYDGGGWRENIWTGKPYHRDGRYDGYVPHLACPAHGGPDGPAHEHWVTHFAIGSPPHPMEEVTGAD